MMSMRDDFVRRKDWKVKVLIGLIIFGLFSAFCIFQFVRFDNAKRNPRYTIDVQELDMNDVEDFDDKQLEDITFPTFTVCPTWTNGIPNNISAMTCTYVTSQGSIPISSITRTKASLFTPHYQTDWDSCYFIYPTAKITDVSYYYDFIDCRATTDGNLMIYFAQGEEDANVPSDNTKWLFIPGKTDVSIGLKRTKRYNVLSELELVSWDFVLQPQNSIPASENPGAIFTIQYAFLGSITQQGFYPYDFWVMCGIIGGTYIIFYAVFVATIFCVFQFFNIRDADDYDQINEK